MPRERVRAVAVCEDAGHQSFLVRLSERLRIEPLKIISAPKGVRAADQWVRERVIEEVREHRSRASNQPKLVLILMTDGDRFGVAARKRSFDRALISAGLDPRSPRERILYLVPTWSIDTWLAWLCAKDKLAPVDEAGTYKKLPRLGAYRALVEAGQITAKLAVERWDVVHSDEATSVPSLTDARQECTRVP
jgi:hypothetical protein